MTTIPMTKNGFNALEKEKDLLVQVERKKIIKAIAEAREHGDLKENAEYHAAKERQSFIEGRILEIEHKLSHAQVIDVNDFKNQSNIVFGATFVLEDVDTKKQIGYQIVGEDEANLKAGKISFLSPIAKAVIGKTIDDEVLVKAPKGDIYYTVIDIKYI